MAEASSSSAESAARSAVASVFSFVLLFLFTFVESPCAGGKVVEVDSFRGLESQQFFFPGPANSWLDVYLSIG